MGRIGARWLLLLSFSLGGAFAALPAMAAGPTAVVVRSSIAPLPAAFSSDRARLIGAMSPGLRAKVAAVARTVVNQLGKPVAPGAVAPSAQAVAKATVASAGNLGLGGLSSSDIEALVTMVMMEATADANQDLQAVMSEIQVLTKAKQCARNAACLAAITPGGDLRLAELTAFRANLAANLNNLGDLSEQAQLQLQMCQSVYSQCMEALSNIMKSMAATSSSIVQNMKS